jgi:hypothetical protein
VEDSPEPEVCERNVVKPLVAPGSWAVELSSRSSSGRSGIGRTRRSTQCLGGLPTRGCGGQVTRSSGSEEPTGSTGSVTSTGRRRGGTPVLWTSSEGPLSLIPMRALLTFRSARRGELASTATRREGRGASGALPPSRRICASRSRRVGAYVHPDHAESSPNGSAFPRSKTGPARARRAPTGLDHSSTDGDDFCGERGTPCGRSRRELWTILRNSRYVELRAENPLCGAAAIP